MEQKNPDFERQPLRHKRVLLKISGESLSDPGSGHGLNFSFLNKLATDMAAVTDTGVQLCLVVGGGNFCRGAAYQKNGMDRPTADTMGMLATVMNGLALQQALMAQGLKAKVISALFMPTVADSYHYASCMRDLDLGYILIFVGGSGAPYFTTDTAAVLRGLEMGCDLIMKATQVDGVYSADPKTHKDAVFYDHISYADVMDQDLRVMDQTAIALASENNIPLVVFSIHEKNSILNTLYGKGRFSFIGESTK